MEMACQQTILHQKEFSILQSSKKVLWLQMNLQKQLAASKNPTIKTDFNGLEEEKLEDI